MAPSCTPASSGRRRGICSWTPRIWITPIKCLKCSGDESLPFTWSLSKNGLQVDLNWIGASSPSSTRTVAPTPPTPRPPVDCPNCGPWMPAISSWAWVATGSLWMWMPTIVPGKKWSPERTLFVHCDAATSRMVGSKVSNVLREISYRADGTTTHFEPQHIHYLPVRSGLMEIVETHVTETDDQQVTFGPGSTLLTLHFKKGWSMVRQGQPLESQSWCSPRRPPSTWRWVVKTTRTSFPPTDPTVSKTACHVPFGSWAPIGKSGWSVCRCPTFQLWENRLWPPWIPSCTCDGTSACWTPTTTNTTINVENSPSWAIRWPKRTYWPRGNNFSKPSCDVTTKPEPNASSPKANWPRPMASSCTPSSSGPRTGICVWTPRMWITHVKWLKWNGENCWPWRWDGSWNPPRMRFVWDPISSKNFARIPFPTLWMSPTPSIDRRFGVWTDSISNWAWVAIGSWWIWMPSFIPPKNSPRRGPCTCTAMLAPVGWSATKSRIFCGKSSIDPTRWRILNRNTFTISRCAVVWWKSSKRTWRKPTRIL